MKRKKNHPMWSPSRSPRSDIYDKQDGMGGNVSHLLLTLVIYKNILYDDYRRTLHTFCGQFSPITFI